MIHIFPFKFAAEYVCNERNKRLNEPPDELIIDGTYGDERAEVQKNIKQQAVYLYTHDVLCKRQVTAA